ncbi:uncharacterized protein LOC144163940 [Haemaphysalis longicornis]
MQAGKHDERRSVRAKALARQLEEDPLVLYANASLPKHGSEATAVVPTIVKLVTSASVFFGVGTVNNAIVLSQDGVANKSACIFLMHFGVSTLLAAYLIHAVNSGIAKRMQLYITGAKLKLFVNAVALAPGFLLISHPSVINETLNMHQPKGTGNLEKMDRPKETGNFEKIAEFVLVFVYLGLRSFGAAKNHVQEETPGMFKWTKIYIALAAIANLSAFEAFTIYRIQLFVNNMKA